MREHPVLTITGVAGLGLFAGPELALGVLIGAGVAVAVRAAPHLESARANVRQRARSILDRAPEEVKTRARAVVQTARGKIAPAGQPRPVAPEQISDDSRVP